MHSQNGENGPFQDIHDLDPQVDEEPRIQGTEHYIQLIKETADKLLRDHANRGDVKLLATALRELRYCFKVFAAYRGQRKVTVFGSARLPLDHPSCQQAEEFGRRMAAAGFLVITGAAQGIMEAGHIGAGRASSIGVNILLPFEQQANPTIHGDSKLMHLKYFFTRKLLFVKESDAVALFPGGFGTMDEGFEVLTLVQTGKSHLFPIVLVEAPGDDYWQRWLGFIRDVLLDRGLISPYDLALFKLTASVDEAVEEIRRFYSVFHSMRYVRGDLVLRLQKRLSEALLDRIRDEFKDITKSGTFEQTGALAAETGDHHLADLPRLKFKFDRHKLGRLRMLVDLVNAEG
ncbi:MAG: TIGR00730 family Rossman fold protein [Gemmataceae bacterium]|nr:TIGR00730 family Rossman fold protein [Gemmataceae bacterium]MCI0740588.1 TIGR00730 family Rossman fold protein [Gemmataceae bacterium]